MPIRNPPEFEKNARRIVDLLTKIKNEEEQIRQGGGAKAIESQHKKGRLTARERIAKLIDPGSQFFELGIYAAYRNVRGMGRRALRREPSPGWRKVCGRTFMIIANDATVKAGAFFPMTAKKVIRAQNIAIENHIPTIYLVDSAGVFLPLQEDVFPDTDDFGRVFRNNAVMSAMGIPADHRHHGHVRRRRRVSSRDVRSHFDDRRLGTLSRRTRAGAGRNRAENFRGRFGRCKDARANQRHGGFSRAG